MDSREQSNEIWWLIEKINQQSDGKQFWSGSEWVTSALKAARFPSQEAAQNVLDNFIESISAFGTPYLLRAFAKPVEHMWVTVPQSKPQVRVSELVAQMRRDARAFEDTDPDNERTVTRHRAKAEILKQWADKIALLDLQPDPPTDAMLTDEEIEAVVRAAFNADALLQHYVESRGHWERLTPIVAQAAAKKAFAAGKNEVLKDPERFGLAKIADDQSAECSGLEGNSIPNMITQDYLNGRESMLKAGFRKVVIQKVQK